jgi:hypothetical protein
MNGYNVKLPRARHNLPDEAIELEKVKRATDWFLSGRADE